MLVARRKSNVVIPPSGLAGAAASGPSRRGHQCLRELISMTFPLVLLDNWSNSL